MFKFVTVKSQMYDNVNGFGASTNEEDQIRYWSWEYKDLLSTVQMINDLKWIL